MSIRRLVLLAGAIALVAGVIGLLVPVSVPGPDNNSIGCGNAVASDLSQARSANSKTVANIPVLNDIVPHDDYVAACQSALSQRRSWSIPLAAVGAVVAVGALVVGGRAGRG